MHKQSHELTSHIGKLADRGTYDLISIVTQNFTNSTYQSLTIDNSIIQHTDLSETKWSKLHFLDVKLDRCNLSNADWFDASLSKLSIIHCRATGLKLNESYLKSMLATDSKIDMAQFRFAKIEDVIFERCDMREADFYHSELKMLHLLTAT